MKFVAALLLATVAAVRFVDEDDRNEISETSQAGSSSFARGDALPDMLKPKAPLTALQIYGLKEKCNELFRQSGQKITLEYPDLVKEATGAVVVKFAQSESEAEKSVELVVTKEACDAFLH